MSRFPAGHRPEEPTVEFSAIKVYGFDDGQGNHYPGILDKLTAYDRPQSSPKDERVHMEWLRAQLKEQGFSA